MRPSPRPGERGRLWTARSQRAEPRLPLRVIPTASSGKPINPPHGNKAARARIRLSRGGDLGADPPDQRRKDFLLLLVEQRVFCSHLTYQELFLGQRLHLLVLSVLSVSRQTFKEALPEHEEGGNPCVVSSKGHLPLGSA